MIIYGKPHDIPMKRLPHGRLAIEASTSTLLRDLSDLGGELLAPSCAAARQLGI